MKKLRLPVMMLVPLLIGLLYRWLLTLPLIGWLAFYLGPFVIAYYWFNTARGFAKDFKNPLAAVFTLNAVGIASLALFCWQHLDVVNRDMTLYNLSIAFTAPVTVIGAMLTGNNEPGILMQVISLLFMMAAFAAGFFMQRYVNDKEEKNVYSSKVE